MLLIAKRQQQTSSKLNHPLTILKQTPKITEKRLSKSSSNQNLFNNKSIIMMLYRITDAIMKFTTKKNAKTNKKNRKRKYIWFN